MIKTKAAFIHNDRLGTERKLFESKQELITAIWKEIKGYCYPGMFTKDTKIRYVFIFCSLPPTHIQEMRETETDRESKAR